MKLSEKLFYTAMYRGFLVVLGRDIPAWTMNVGEFAGGRLWAIPLSHSTWEITAGFAGIQKM